MQKANTQEEDLIFYHCPHTRSGGIRLLIEELKAPHKMEIVNISDPSKNPDAFSKANPLGGVPAIVWKGQPVTESVAICLLLADVFPNARLAPGLDDPLRGPYLRWFVYYAACFEPAIQDKALGHDAGSYGQSPYGSFEAMFKTLDNQLAHGPYFLGNRKTALDIHWGVALQWIVGFNLIPKTDSILRYVDLMKNEPLALAVAQKDNELAESLKV